MKVNLYGRNATYDVYWKHDPNSHYDGKRLTVCNINQYTSEKGKMIEVGGGCAQCSRSDQYCKETGRKVSLAKALKAIKFTRGERAEFWKAYFNRDAKAIST